MAVKNGFFGLKEETRLCDLVIEGSALVEPRRDKDEVLEEMQRRQELQKDGLEALARGFAIPRFADFRGFSKPQTLTTYRQLMLQVSQYIPDEVITSALEDIRYKRGYSPQQVKERERILLFAVQNMRQFSNPRFYDNKLQQLARRADKKPIDNECYFRAYPKKASRLVLVLKKNKNIYSFCEKNARRIVARSDPRKPMLETTNLRDLNVNDGFGVKWVFLTQSNLYRALNRLRLEDQRGREGHSTHGIRIAFEERGQFAIRDYINDTKKDGRPYEAVHVNLAPLGGGPDLYEGQFLTVDNILIELFDPDTNHLVYEHRRIDRAHQEEQIFDGKTVRKEWSKAQKKFYRNLHEQMKSAYGI